MFVDVNNKKYKVFWRYGEKAIPLRERVKLHRTTECHVFDGDDKDVELAFGVVSTSHLDNFSKKEGRKQSLSRALTGSSLPKDDRKRIWEEYFKLQHEVYN